MRAFVRAAAVGLLPVSLSLSLLLGAGAAQAALPDDYQLPFSCGETWLGSTRSGHSPSYWSVDFNRDGDLGALTLASASGVVSRVEDLGDRSYGKYVVVEHRRGRSTLYAHLSQLFVSVGQRLRMGAAVGAVGTSGGSTGPHLHYEQRKDRTNHAVVFNGEHYDYGTSITSANCGDIPVTGDWDGDGRTDVGVNRPRRGTGNFRLRLPSGTTQRVRYGAAGTVPITGDWNGDGRSEVGVWDHRTRTAAIRLPNGQVAAHPTGRKRDLPVTGDWDGDGRTDLGVWRPYSAKFVRITDDGSRHITTFGATANMPVTGDWDADGRADIGVVDTLSMQFFLMRGDDTVKQISLGSRGDWPVTGDWNGNGTTDIGVWRPSTGEFLLRLGPYRVRTIRYGRIR